MPKLKPNFSVLPLYCTFCEPLICILPAYAQTVDVFIDEFIDNTLDVKVSG